MRDFIVRKAFHNSILRTEHLDSNTFVVDELGLKNGQVRADIAVLNGKLVGYEIKTERDNLNRLAPQVQAYSAIFDKAYIVAGEKHLQKVMEKIPEWWGIYAIVAEDEGVCSFRMVRNAAINTGRDAYSIAQLLWKDEVINLLEQHFECKLKKNLTKQLLYDTLIEQCDIETLAKLTLQILKHRQGWRINPQPLL